MILVISAECANAQDHLNIDRKYPVIEAENKVWIGTPSGLYQYNSDDDSFKLFTLPITTGGQNIRQLYYHDEWLWCLLDSGVAALHIRLSDWLIHNVENGLPSNRVESLSFEDDYVWAATDAGAARFDLLIEEWEIYDQTPGATDPVIKDILAKGDAVWIIHEHLLSEYSPTFDRWREYAYETDPAVAMKRAFFLDDELWQLSDVGLLRYSTTLKTQQAYELPYLFRDNLIDLIIENDVIWAITRSGLYYYAKESEVWKEFKGNSYLAEYSLVGAWVDDSEIWVLSDEGVHVWDRSDENWGILDYASGLSGSSFESVYVNGDRVFLLGPSIIEYRQYADDIWRQHEITAGPEGDKPTGKGILENLLDNEEGGAIQLGEHRWGWDGTRVTLVRDFSQRFDSEGAPDEAEILFGSRLDIKSRLDLGETRSLSGFYNNIDYSETMYGIRYRSRHDFLREYTWGDFRREPGAIPFGESSSIFGHSIWLQAGAKTERYKRSLLTAKAYSGERRSQKTYENYKGATKQFRNTIDDVDYEVRQFYAIPGLGSGAVPSSVEVYVDDLTSANNTPNTLKHTTIAGIAGDFDELHVTEDYYFYDKAGVIRFTSYLHSASTVVIRYSTQGGVVEDVLQFGGVITTSLKNFYYLNAEKMIPYSFQLEIADHTGATVPLNQFGLDPDGDGRIDSRWIDYENGVLFFPDPEPFPAGVYDPDQPESSYRMDASFQTEYSLIQLQHDNLVRGSEIVTLDGATAEGGNDYVLDYTNGTLVFITEGLVNADTRIEIEYEYYVTTETTQVHGAMVQYSPSDNLYVQADVTSFTDQENASAEDATENLVAVHSEIRHQVGDFDLKVTPAVAYQSEANDIVAGSVEGLVSSSKLRFQVKRESYAREYSNLYRPQSILGDVKSKTEYFASADVLDYLRFSGEWNNVEGFEQDGSSLPTDRSRSLTMLLHRNNWPGWKLSYRDFKTNTTSGTVEKFDISSNLEYQLPQSFAQGIGLQALKTEAFYRLGEESGSTYANVDSLKVRLGYVRLNASISDQFQGSIYYRRGDNLDMSDGHQNSSITRKEKLLFNLSHEEWRLLQMNLRVENNLDQGFHRGQSSVDASLSQYSQLNLRLSPGRLWSKLSPLHFEYNINQSLFGWGATDGAVSSWIWQMFRSNTDRLTDSQTTRNQYLISEFRPGSRWYLYSMLEWNDQENGQGASSRKSSFWRLSEKLDLKVGFETRMNLQFKHFDEDKGYSRTTRYNDYSARIEHRWTPELHNTLYGHYRRTNEVDGEILDITQNWEASYDINLRKAGFLGIRRMEITQKIAGSSYITEGYTPREYVQLSAGTSLDLYPLHSTILRLQVNALQNYDRLDSENDYTDIDYSLRVTLKF